MSTIPSTIDGGAREYAVLAGSPPRPGEAPVSAVVINRGGRHFDRGIFDALERASFPSILSIEVKDEGLDVEALAARHPRLGFLFLKEEASVGEMVNLGIKEAWGEFAFVAMSDIEPDFMTADASLVDRLRSLDALCVTPTHRGLGGALRPSVVAPAMDASGRLRFVHLEGERDGERTLFPPDYSGFYSRPRFLLTGGYDPGIANPLWQKADFGFRAYLWGERIKRGSREKVIHLSNAEEAEDAVTDASYRRFFLKNLAVKKRGDAGILPYSAFLPRAFGAGIGMKRAWEEFKDARAWVETNRYRFLTDAAAVVDLWGTDA
jgi:hypothetical protein